MCRCVLLCCTFFKWKVKFRVWNELVCCLRIKYKPSMPVGRPAPASTNIGRLDTNHNTHWPTRNHPKARCRVCSARGVRREVVFKCVKCDVVLCVDWNCFEDYHTKTNFWDIVSIVLCTNRWSLDHNVSKRTCIYLQVCLESHLLHYAIRNI